MFNGQLSNSVDASSPAQFLEVYSVVHHACQLLIFLMYAMRKVSAFSHITRENDVCASCLSRI